MYISSKNLDKIFGIRYNDAAGMTLEHVKSAIMEKVDEYGLDVEFSNEEVGYGMFSGTKPCLVMSHPVHKANYYMYVIMLAPQGKTCVIEAYLFGNSTQMSKEDFANNTQVFTGQNTRNAAVGLLRGGALGIGFAAGSLLTGAGKAGIKAIAKGINALTRDPMALEEERSWYDLANTVLQEAIC